MATYEYYLTNFADIDLDTTWGTGDNCVSSQTFTVGTVGSNVNFNITGVALCIERFYTGPPTAGATLCVYKTNSSGNTDYGNILCSSNEIPASQFPYEGEGTTFTIFTMSSNPTLTASNKYAIGITTSTKKYNIQGKTTGSYSGGVWETNSSSDVGFAIYGTASSTNSTYNIYKTDSMILTDTIYNQKVGSGYITIDDCEVANWTDSPAVTSITSSVHQEGSYGLSLTKDGTGASGIACYKTTPTINFTNKDFNMSLYIADTATYNKLNTGTGSLTALEIRFGSDASNYYEWNKLRSNLAVGWNFITALNTSNITASAGSPVVTACDYTYIAMQSTGSAATWADGSIVMDDLKASTTAGSGSTYNAYLTNSMTLTDATYTQKSTGAETFNVYKTDSAVLTDTAYKQKVSGGVQGLANRDTFWINNNGTWIEFDYFDYFKIKKLQNQMSEFEVSIFDISTAQKLYFKEQAEVLFFCGTNMVLKGRIQTIEYNDTYGVIARGFGMETKLLDQELIVSGDNRVQYDNTSAKSIVTEINSNILTTTNAGIFATDYGLISLRFEYANRLNALGKTCEAIDYNWWVSQTSTDGYDADYLNVNMTQGSTSSVKTFTLTSNATAISQERDINNLVNYVHCLGYGDGINQLATSVYAASTQSSFLNANIESTNSTITCSSTVPFATTGSARIAEEIINYAGKVTASATLTGCIRGVSGSTAKAHNKNCYIEQYYPTNSAQTGSSINVYGLMDHTLIYKTIINEELLEVIASGYLSDRKNPIVSISITSDEPLTDATLNIGDIVTVTASESNVDGTYHIVKQEYNSNYGVLDMTTEVSNRSLEFIEQMNKAREDAETMGKYMQGATNVYGINEAENCDPSYPLNLRFYIPEEAVAINKVLLNYKMKPYRAYINETHSAGATGNNLYNIHEESLSDPGVLISVGEEGSETYVGITPLTLSNLVNMNEGTVNPNQDGNRLIINNYDDSVEFGRLILEPPVTYEDGQSTSAQAVKLFCQENNTWDIQSGEHIDLIYGETSSTQSAAIYYNSGDDTAQYSALNTVEGQSFTASANVTMSGINLKLYKRGNPGNANLSVRLGTNPTGSNLSTGSINGNTLTTNSSGEWVYFTMSAMTLTASNQYSLVLNVPAGSANNEVWWRYDNADGTYANGSRIRNTASGTASWQQLTTSDHVFEILKTDIAGSETKSVYLPNITDTNDHTYYISSDGSTWEDENLTALACAAASGSDQVNIDITERVTNVGAGNWCNIKFEPNQEMRIEADCYIQTFIESN